MRRATITSRLDDAPTVAEALAPDDTDEIDTRVDDGRLVATIDRDSTSGLRSTVDDYIVNLDVAVQVAGHTTTEHEPS